MIKVPVVEISEETDPAELAKAHRRREQFDKNSVWLQARVAEIYSQHRGKVICVAGEELFVADSTAEAVAKATSAHPQDEGYFTRYIPLVKVPRIYANERGMDDLRGRCSPSHTQSRSPDRERCLAKL